MHRAIKEYLSWLQYLMSNLKCKHLFIQVYLDRTDTIWELFYNVVLPYKTDSLYATLYSFEDKGPFFLQNQ